MPTASDDDPVEGLSVEPVARWLTAHVDGLQPPLRFDLIAGGRSNLTYAVTDDRGERIVLRRPPVGDLAATAHDVGREHRILRALHADGTVPVPEPLAHCADPAVIGAPFTVMAHVDGIVAADPDTANQLPHASRHTAGTALVDVLADLHAVDVDTAGLGDLGRRDGYLVRQLRRWYGQYRDGAPDDPVGLLDEVHDELARRVPPQGGTALVHGDYRLENVIVGPDGQVRAVLDWELCTLGDPLADLGLLQVYWSEPGGERFPGPTRGGGFPEIGELVERYAERTHRDLGSLPVFVAFGYWKLACIAHAMHRRALAGVVGGDLRGLHAIGAQVDGLARAAARTLGG